MWLAALAAASHCPAAAGQVPGAGFDVARYDVALSPDLGSGAVAGIESVTLTSTVDALREVAFSPNALTVWAAQIADRATTVTATSEAIVFTLPQPLPRGRSVTLRFRISGVPRRGMEASSGLLYTSYFACDWMVCLQDSPGDKAMFALDLAVPAGLETLSIGRKASAAATDGGGVVHRWRSGRPYSPYLFAFAVGRFTARKQSTPAGKLIFLGAHGTGADLDRAFAQTPAIAAFFAEKAGVSLPARRYAQLLVPGREAQEAATFALIGKDEIDREGDKPSDAWVVAHELAHQWWGNLVTCATWRDFWLNEGVTTFMTAAWKERRFGRAAYLAELAVARGRLERARALGYDKPLTWDGAYPSLGVRRAVQYSKGALFLDHIRTAIGDAAFWRGLRSFTRAHAGGTVTSGDFQRSMEAASGRDLSSMFAEWVFGA